MPPRKLSFLKTLRENAFQQLTTIFIAISQVNIPLEETRECGARLQELEDEIEEANAKADPNDCLPTRAAANSVLDMQVKIEAAPSNRMASLAISLPAPTLTQGFPHSPATCQTGLVSSVCSIRWYTPIPLWTPLANSSTCPWH